MSEFSLPTQAQDLSGRYIGALIDVTPPKERRVEGRITLVQHERPWGVGDQVRVILSVQAVEGQWRWHGSMPGDTVIEIGFEPQP